MNFLKIFDLLSSSNRQGSIQNREERSSVDWPYSIAVFVILNYVGWVVWYVILRNYFDHVEPSIAAISWIFINGAPLYHPIDSPDQYNMVYGPIVFLINGLLMKVFTPTILTSKLAGGIFSIGSVFFLGYSVRQFSNIRNAVLASAFLILVYVSFWPFTTFISRADALILGFLAFGLVGLNAKSSRPAVLILIIAAGACFNIKVHSILYFAPLWAIMLTRFGIVPVLISGFGALAAATLPFIFIPNISFEHFTTFLFSMGGREYSLGEIFYRNLYNLISFQFIPLLLVLSLFKNPRKIIRENWFFLAVLAGSVLLVLIIASRPGAGKFHLLPFSIPLIYWKAWLILEGGANQLNRNTESFKKQSGLISILLILLVLAIIPVHTRMVKLSTYNTRGNGAIEDLRKIMQENPGKKIAMGFGNTDQIYLSWYLPILVFAGNPYPLDLSTIMELKYIHMMDIAPKIISGLDGCRNDIWLIPKGGHPFNHLGVYLGNLILNEDYRKKFRENYQLRKSSEFYDLWYCNPKN